MVGMYERLTLLVRSRWKKPHECTYAMPREIPSAKRNFVGIVKLIEWFPNNCSNEPPFINSVNACNCPSCTQTPINLKSEIKWQNEFKMTEWNATKQTFLSSVCMDSGGPMSSHATKWMMHSINIQNNFMIEQLSTVHTPNADSYLKSAKSAPFHRVYW